MQPLLVFFIVAATANLTGTTGTRLGETSSPGAGRRSRLLGEGVAVGVRRLEEGPW